MTNQTSQSAADVRDRQQVESLGVPRVSIVIKARNEEKNVERALRSAVAAANLINGEVILADSASTDRTVDIARAYPVKIVQLIDPQEACCGIGPELGFRVAKGKFICIMDADMRLMPDFLPQAIKAMEIDEGLGGVGGRLIEVDACNDQAARRAAEVQLPGSADKIDGLGVYRRSALVATGYFSDRNLHSYEEFDLAARLRVCGWKLQRLPIVSAEHEGHKDSNYTLLRRRWHSRYAWGAGELVRAAIGKPHLPIVLAHADVRLWIMVIGWWLVLSAITTLTLVTDQAWLATVSVALLITPLVLMCFKRRSFVLGLFSVVSWQVYAAGFVAGLLRSRRAPRDPIAAHYPQESG